MSVEVKMTVKFQPWTAPNFAVMSQEPGRKEDGMRALPSIAIADLESAVIDMLAQEWLTDLYSKAGRHSPFCIIRQC